MKHSSNTISPCSQEIDNENVIYSYKIQISDTLSKISTITSKQADGYKKKTII